MAKQEVGTFTCGHDAIIKPGSFGRGQAREKSLVEYFSRSCLSCAQERAKKHVSKLTKIDGTPLPQERQEARLQAMLAKLSISYLKTEN